MNIFYQVEGEGTGPIPSSSQEMSVWRRMLNIFIAPATVFPVLKKKPEFIMPLVVVLLVFMMFMYTNKSLILKEQKQKLLSNKKISEEVREKQLEAMENFSTGQVILFFIVIPTVSMAFLYFILGFIYYFVGNFVFGGKASYTQILSIYGYSYLILGLGGLIIKWILIYFSGTLHVYTSLAALLPLEKEQTVLFKLLDLVDIIYIWWIYVFGMGLAKIYDWKLTKGISLVAGLYIIYGLLKIIITAVL